MRWWRACGWTTWETLNANPLELVNLIVTHLTERGVIEPGLHYEPKPVRLVPNQPFSPWIVREQLLNM